MAKKVIKLTSEELHNLIAEATEKVLKEGEPSTQSNWQEAYVGKTFKFFGEGQMGLPAHVLFTFDKCTKLEPKKTILVGTVTFNDTQISGDGIIVDFTKNTVKYRAKGSRYVYNLEIDNRYKPVWTELLAQLQVALASRNK